MDITPLVVENLYKFYKDKKEPAAKAISFSVEKGQIFGLIGPNGAGKSTTVRCILGLSTPERGNIRIFNIARNDLEDFKKIKHKIGYIPQDGYPYPFLTGRQYIAFVGRLYQVPSEEIENRTRNFLNVLVLKEEVLDQPLSRCSGGERQKILLISTFIHKPELLILDEPFRGLDPNALAMVRKYLKVKAIEGKAILTTMHQLSELQQFCTHIGLIVEGELSPPLSISSILKEYDTLEQYFLENCQEIVNLMFPSYEGL
ncbi:MAG: ABC transporter ATP-binding protein [Candidatus Helarchaeota archaeon]